MFYSIKQKHICNNYKIVKIEIMQRRKHDAQNNT